MNQHTAIASDDRWKGEHKIRAPKASKPEDETPDHIKRRASVAKMFDDGADTAEIAKSLGKSHRIINDDLVALGLKVRVKRDQGPKGDLRLARKIIADFCARHDVSELALCSRGFMDPEMAILRGDCALEVKEACNPNGQMLEKLFNRTRVSVRKSILAARKRRDGK